MNNIDFELDVPDTLTAPLMPDESLNSNYTAIPKGFDAAGDAGVDLDLVVDQMEYGDMNEPEAIESGYMSGAKANLIPDAIKQPPALASLKQRPYLNTLLGFGVLAVAGWITVRFIANARSTN